jgi:precorrin-6B methylase 2
VSSGIEYKNYFWPDVEQFNFLDMVICEGCRFGFTAPELSADFLGEFYDHAYYRPDSVHYFNPDQVAFKRSHIDLRSLSQLLLAIPFTEFSEGDRFLDIGPGAGASFNTAINLLPNPQLFAVEANANVRGNLERNFPSIHVVPDVSSLAHNFASTRFRLILMSHCLELFNGSEVISVLELLRSLLKEKGVLIIEVPLVDLRAHHVAMRYNDAPHLCFFSVDALRYALQRSGYRVLFLNSCDEYYDKWWRKVQALNLPEKYDRTLFFQRIHQMDSHQSQHSRPEASRFKSRARKEIPAAFWYRMSKVRSALLNSGEAVDVGSMCYEWLSSTYFEYGGDRTVLSLFSAL